MPKSTAEQFEKSLDDFLIDHWSVSAVSEFIRNEKSFERKYIFRVRDHQQSLAQIIGTVYHKVLMHFFIELRDAGNVLSLDQLAEIAHAQLDRIGADRYRPQKKKTIQELQLSALKAINALIQNFLQEFDAYRDEIQEVLFVEETFQEFVKINEVEIPLPLKVIPDVVFINKEGYLCIFDHKAKHAYSAEKDIKLRYSNQSIGYSLCINALIQSGKLPGFPEILTKYPKAGEGVKKFFYYENKYSRNKDGSRQIRQIPIDIESEGPLFEQMLFEGVFRMVEAVQNPDYVYLMNPNDHFQDSGEIVEFWIKTHIEGLEGFPNLKANTKRLLKKRRSAIRRSALTGIPKSVIRSYTKPKDFLFFNPVDMENLTTQERIELRLKTFNYPVRAEHKIAGYSCDTYLFSIAAGLKVSQIYGYRMDIANAAGVKDVRILPEQVEYKGGVYIGIEINRKDHQTLTISEKDRLDGNQFPIGRDNFENLLAWSIDNPSTPHMMIAGASGSGKSVAIRTIIQEALRKGIHISILDPKREFLEMKDKVDVYNELEDIEDFMEEKVAEMDDIFRRTGATGSSTRKQLVIFDEAADCFARQTRERREEVEEGTYANGLPKTRFARDKKFKTLEENTIILAQKARSAGIHLVLAAQRFSTKVLSGDAKANFPVRLCLTVASAVDSRVMLDAEGAEKLAGKGDALFTAPGIGTPVRIQCFSTT